MSFSNELIVRLNKIVNGDIPFMNEIVSNLANKLNSKEKIFASEFTAIGKEVNPFWSEEVCYQNVKIVVDLFRGEKISIFYEENGKIVNFYSYYYYLDRFPGNFYLAKT